MTLHGDTRIDNYYWLRDDERARPDVLEYLHAENAYGKQVMDSQLSLQERLLKEIIDRIPQREVSAPYSKNGFRYRQVYEPGCEYAIYQRQSVLKEEWDEWEILLDANQRAAKSEFYTLGGLGIAPNNQLMAVAEDYLSRASTVCVFATSATASGIRRPWKMSPPALPGAMIHALCGTCVNIPPRCFLIRSGATPLGRRRRATCWSTRKKMRPSTSACIKPHPSSSW